MKSGAFSSGFLVSEAALVVSCFLFDVCVFMNFVYAVIGNSSGEMRLRGMRMGIKWFGASTIRPRRMHLVFFYDLKLQFHISEIHL